MHDGNTEWLLLLSIAIIIMSSKERSISDKNDKKGNAIGLLQKLAIVKKYQVGQTVTSLSCSFNVSPQHYNKRL